VNSVAAQAGILGGVSPDAAAALARGLPHAYFPRKYTIFAEGQAGDELFIIVAGKVKIYQTTPRGKQTLLSLLGPADIFGELAVVDPSPRSATATTVTEVHAVTMDRSTLQNRLVEHPEVAVQLVRALTRRLRHTNNLLYDRLMFSDVSTRVARQLLALARQFGAVANAHSLTVDHQLTQTELAQLVGAARETVNQTLSNFTHLGWIHHDGQALVIDKPAKLVALARAAPPLEP
jgi:CRP/FNR family transcriptional regulator, cyclic AMP receptor protein